MSKSEYQVNGNPAPKDTSFRSFICALLVFLALCLAIYLVLALVKPRGSTEETGAFRKETEDVEVVEGGHEKSEKDKLTAINVPVKKEFEETTPSRATDHTVEKITERTSTARVSYEKTTTLGNDIDFVSGTEYRKEKVQIYTKESFETTTNSSPVEDKSAVKNWGDTTISEATTKFGDGLSTYIGENILSTTNIPHIINKYKNQNTLGTSTEGITNNPSTEYNIERRIVQSTDDRDTTVNEATTRFGDEFTSTSYKDENIPSTTNIPHITKDQNNLDTSTEGVTKDTSTEFIYGHSKDESFTENSMYSSTTEKEVTVDLGINDTLFYSDIASTQVTYNIEESLTTEISSSSDQTDAVQTNQRLYALFSTARNENESTEESTSENISTEKISNLQSFTAGRDKSTSTDNVDRDTTPSTYQKINYNRVTTEDTTMESTEKAVPSGSDLSTTDIYRLIANTYNKHYNTTDTTLDITTDSSYNQNGTTDLFEKTYKYGSTTEDASTEDITTSNYGFTAEGGLQETARTDDTTEDTTTVSKTIPPYNRKGTTDLNVPTNNYETTVSADLQEVTRTYQLVKLRSIDLETTEQWNSSTVTANVPNTIYLETTTAVPLTTTTMRNYLTPHPVQKVIPTLAPQACISDMCKKTSSKLLYLMNHKEDDICENFFDFACGGQKIDKDSAKKENLKMLINYLDTISNSSEKYLTDFKKFYHSCVQHEQDFKFTQTLKFLAQIPKMSLTELFAELILTQSMPLFDIGIDIAKDTQAYILEVTLPGTSSLTAKVQGWSLMEQIWKECLDAVKLTKRGPNINLHLEHLSVKACEKTRFKNIAENFVEEMTRFSGGTPIYSELNLKNLLFVMNWIQDFSRKGYDVQQTLVDKQYGTSSIAGLKDAIGYSSVDWKTVFDKITFRGPSDKNLLVYFRGYLEYLFKLLGNNFTDGELFNVLWLYSRLQLYVNTGISKKREDREMYCMDLAKQVMPHTVSVIAYKEAGNQFSAIINVKKMFEELKKKLADSIQNSPLQETTKSMLEEKLKKVYLGLITIGDSSTAIVNSQKVVIEEDNYQANLVESLKNYRRIVYSLAGSNATPASLLRYFVDPFYTKPKLFEARNVIVAQMAFFENYPLSVPEYIRLPTMGMHLSQELIKVITDRETREKQFYQDLVTSTKDLLIIYANYTYNVQGSRVFFNLSSNLWISQMIVDNAAFKLTLDRFSDLESSNKLNSMANLPWIANDYPMDKIFFIAAAQEYCQEYTPMDFMQDIYITGDLPPPLRVQNFLSNSEKFSTVFDCATGSPMAVQTEMIAQFPNLDYDYEDGSISN